uniref:Ig-like domain-containing protein n=1 Tax=Poecilia reticulata TaxID=8081 RepID=A0A3P9Q1B1_POERE
LSSPLTPGVCLTVYGNPSVTQSPAVKSAALGETLRVDGDLSWCLQKPGQPPKLLFYKIASHQSDTPSHFSSSGSEPQFTLTISGVQADDAGDYYCMGVKYETHKQFEREIKLRLRQYSPL